MPASCRIATASVRSSTARVEIPHEVAERGAKPFAKHFQRVREGLRKGGAKHIPWLLTVVDLGSTEIAQGVSPPGGPRGPTAPYRWQSSVHHCSPLARKPAPDITGEALRPTLQLEAPPSSQRCYARRAPVPTAALTRGASPDGPRYDATDCVLGTVSTAGGLLP